MILIPPRKMVGHGYGVEDPVASDQFTKLIPFVRPVETRGNENGDRTGGHSSLDQLFYQWSQMRPLGTGRVMSQMRMQQLWQLFASSRSVLQFTGFAKAALMA